MLLNLEPTNNDTGYYYGLIPM